ncbi:MAG TPA: alginate lyase family protein, partial [Pseudomonadales bacterium]|nr:alginate lyase family protein [Pseudomonadales bacterium]
MRHWHFVVRLFYTLWPMLPMQWFYLVYYRLLRKKIAPCQTPLAIETRSLGFRQFPVLPQGRLQGDRFVFLNVVAPWPLTRIDWVASEQKKLWRYNLHYFDWLRETEPYSSAWLCSINDWIEGVPYGEGDAWEPYPLSLRIVNWIKWLAQHPEQASDAIKASLYQQCYALEQQIEFHIQANHLYKNAIALLFAGCYFKDSRAQRWFQQGQKLFLAETHRQFLADGGHFERSPLYHSLCLEDLLDAVNLYACENRDLPDPNIKTVAEAALFWLVQLCDPEGNIVLLNDSAWGIAPTPASLCDYALRLGLRVDHQPALGFTALQQSGYFIYNNDTFKLLFDVSDVGPVFQPGHTHCDMLSFLVWHRGLPVFIDSGVGSYLDDDDRRYARATRAHNTVTIDHLEQSDIWSAFRVGKRARITHASQVW